MDPYWFRVFRAGNVRVERGGRAGRARVLFAFHRMKVSTQLRGSLGFAMKSMLLKKRRVMAKVEVEKRKRALIHAKKKQNYAQQVADDSVLPPLERETLVELRKGGLAASNQIRKVKRELDGLDEGFFLRLCTTLLKESLYDPAKALFVVRMQRPELYTRQTSMMLLRNAVKNEDNVFTKRVTSELLENEFHSATSTSKPPITTHQTNTHTHKHREEKINDPDRERSTPTRTNLV